METYKFNICGEIREIPENEVLEEIGNPHNNVIRNAVGDLMGIELNVNNPKHKGFIVTAIRVW